jgi:hypothetical protein
VQDLLIQRTEETLTKAGGYLKQVQTIANKENDANIAEREKIASVPVFISLVILLIILLVA